MKTYLVNLIGGPASGKTCLAALLFAKLKIQGYIVEYVQEVAKGLVWMEDYEMLNNQYWVSQKQFNILNCLQEKVQFIITDGCMLHGIYYNRNNEGNVSNVDKTEKYIWDCYHKFHNINIFLIRGDYPYEQAGRQQSEEESRCIDSFFLDLLKKRNLPFESFKAKPEVDDMIEYILKQTNT